ncbi:MAG: PD-(D/E)XK nuclease family protein [Acidobacteria bacterium]|nr:PD-(D/E)XK nuclease family protein [Acidobacteriota bacterium]
MKSVEFIGDGARVIGLEQKFEETWNGFRLIGYIDRVDETRDGLIAIDYKTSSVAPKGAKDESGKLTVDVQIPLYSNVALKTLSRGHSWQQRLLLTGQRQRCSEPKKRMTSKA